ncbi:2-(3-amino-3-carboxypropyl)histidine synthase subunit 2 [Gryllus bimaculatus]|nr:2-(3-amino-3-carboxypropyl)histidine synthase subunit 2 [Gryllus bimaculatus]
MYTVKDILPSEKSPANEVTAPECDKSIRKEFELERCIEWITEKGLKRVCVQFAQDQIHKAPRLVHMLESELKQKIYILGDTSYGSCCVDEVAAQHVNADSIIHFGHACLSPSERIPVLYIFNKEHIDIEQFKMCMHDTFACEDKILLLYDVSYQHAICAISQYLKKSFDNLIVSELLMDGKVSFNFEHIFFGRVINVPKTKLNDYVIIFIGSDGPCIANFKYLFPGQSFFRYNPALSSFEPFKVNISKFLQKRMYLIESLKNVRNLGILIGTLGVKSYLEAVERIKCLTKPREIKCYIISVGKINVAKLANFPEMDAYVLISCAENSLLDSKEFLQPIVTPYEVELAFNSAYKWSEKYVTDFTTLMPGCDNYVKENDIQENEVNVSLVSSNVQNTLIESNETGSPTSLVSKGLDSLALSESHGCSFLTSRSWVGLEQKLGQNAVEKASQGRSGLPFKYENENA